MTDSAVQKSHHVKFDYSQITEFIFLGSDMHTQGDHYEYLCNLMGTTYDLDIQSERLEPPSTCLESFMWLPVVDHTAPTLEQLDAAASYIDSAVKNQKRIFVHCRNGHERSPTVLAAYFIKQGLSVEKALKKIKAARSEIHPTEDQIKALEQYAQKVGHHA